MIKIKSKVFRIKVNEKFEGLIKRTDKFIEEKYSEGFSIDRQFVSEKIIVISYWMEK